MSNRKALLHCNDRPGEHAPSYYAATANTQLELAPLAGEREVDVCIIGGGFTGLSTALHLRERGYTTALLDAHRVAWGASGRNGGQVGSGQRVTQDVLERYVGRERARAAWDVAQDARLLVKTLIDKHRIDCDYKPGVIHANHRARFDADSAAYVRKLNEEYDYPLIRFLPKDEMRAQLGTENYSGGTLDTGAGHLHPLNYALGIAHAALAAGAEIYEHSEVTGYRAGDKAVVTTARGEVRARFVVIACNGYLGELSREVAAQVMPINNYVIATAPLGDRLASELIRDDVAVADSRFVVNYFRLSKDKRLLFGGGESYRYRFPADIKQFVRKHMLTIYPQLEDIAVDYAWGGTLAVTMKRLPCIRRVAPNVLNASGYSGSGVAMATCAGAIVAEAIDGTASRFDVMQSLPTPPFPGGTLMRSPLLTLGMTWYALRDKL